MANVKIALIQMNVVADKQANLRTALQAVEGCARQGAQIISLPEMFCCPYQNESFPVYAEKRGGPLWNALAEAARDSRVYLVGGSMPEVDEAGRVYNTCYIFDPAGRQIGRHRKMHMFDIDIPGGQKFKESDTLTPGNEVTVVDTPFGRVGVSVCYDLRFPELARLMALRGARLFVIPGAFNMTTGPAHWEMLFRARAVDNQVYTLGCAPARDPGASYVSYGNSLAVSPWGEVLARLGAEAGVLYADLDLERVEQVRGQLPLLKQRRTDLYELKDLTGTI
jgi:omega-amidase